MRWRVLLCPLVLVVCAPDAASAAKELAAAIASAQGAGARKVAVAKLRRALQQARTAGVEDAELLERAEAALSSTSSQEAKLKALRDRLTTAVDGNTPDLEAAIAAAKGAGVAVPPAAESLLASRREESRKVEEARAREASALAELDKAVAANDAAGLRALLSRGSLSADASERARRALDAAEWAQLPRDEQLQRKSSEVGREKCRKPPQVFSPMCRPLSDEEWLKHSRRVGEANCQHPTLQPGGPPAPMPNAAPPETSKHFCKYPPPFDLAPSEEGSGYYPAEFSFPPEFFSDESLPHDEAAKDLAVINLDMALFRSLAPCGGQELWLLEFYVHWCPHCQAMMPKLFKLAVALKAAGVPVRVGAVNCATASDLCGAFQVMGHPMVAFFYGGVGNDGKVQLFDYA